VKSWLKARLGRMRVSTVVLIVAFFALFWVYHNFEPRPAAPEAPPTAVVPPGFVPDPNYTWVPRTNVRRPKETLTTETTTPTTTSPTETTTTTSPGETTSPTSPTESTPTTTSPGATTSTTPTLTPTTTPAAGSGPAQTTPAPPR
jgi:cytoskeletal protein RodZ